MIPDEISQIAPQAFWQELYEPGSFDGAPSSGFIDSFPASLPDGRQLLLPIRTLPGGTDRAVASLIVNQASFVVVDALVDAIASQVAAVRPEVVVGLPTLGLTLAERLARSLGHARYVPLGTSRKFWYDDALSEPLSSITTPGAGRRLYLDPRLLPLISGKRIALVDDVISTGASMRAALALLATAGARPSVVACAMLQGETWRETLPASGWDGAVVSAIATPRLAREGNGAWLPESLSLKA